MVRVNKETEFAVGIKGNTVAIAHRQGHSGKWNVQFKKDFGSKEGAKAFHKAKLDALIKRYPDNIVRSNFKQ